MPRHFGCLETWCRRELFVRAGIGVVDVSKNVGSPSVGEVKAMLTFLLTRMMEQGEV
jgi:hypothetical protein